MKVSKRVPRELSDLLTRAKASGLTDDEIHDRAGLPNGWLSGARRGRYGPQAASWGKLRRFLDRLDAGEKFLGKLEQQREKSALERGQEAFEDFAGSLPSPFAGIYKRANGTPEGAPVVVLDGDGSKTPLGEAILKATTFRKLGALLARIAAAVADGQLDPKKAETLERLVKTRSGILKKEREEQATAKVRALEILTADEVKLLEEHRAKLAGPPLKPGDYPPPPTESEPVMEEQPKESTT
jgi:hypothetical protein